jgi:hypothetical protein
MYEGRDWIQPSTGNLKWTFVSTAIKNMTLKAKLVCRHGKIWTNSLIEKHVSEEDREDIA